MSRARCKLARVAAVLGLMVICGGAKSGGELQYNWRDGEQYAYTFTASQEAPGATIGWSGGCVYTAAQAPRIVRKSDDTGPTSSGTGFVVNAQGHMVTCAHVVKGAAKIEALIGGKRYEAKVIATDKQHDLAVVQVTANDLPIIALADSDKVELNQDVLAVGFPITSIVGENVKMTRGIISGINKARDSDTDKVFQVDAAINPGNSGGPVVNDSGQVIGVASAKLVIAEVSNVGFVVPSNDVARLLKEHGIPYEVKSAGETLKSTDLAKQVTPSVVLLYVTEDPALAMAERRIVNYRAFCQTTSAGAAAGASRTQSTQGRFTASIFGEVSDYSGAKIFPVGAGDVTDMFLDTLSEDGKKKWKTVRLLKFTLTVPQPAPPQPAPAQPAGAPSRLGPRGPRLSRPGGSSHGPQQFGRLRGAQPSAGQTTVTLLAAEASTYQVGETVGNIVTIQKTYEFSTAPKPGEKPLISIKGTGTIEFDLSAGVLKSVVMNMTEEVSAQGQTVQMPMKLNCQRVNASEVRFPEGGTVLASATPNNPPINSSTGPSSIPNGPTRPSSAGPGSAANLPSNRPAAAPKPVPVKLPAPDSAAIAKAERLVESLFKKELDSVKTPAKKLELAKTLIEHAHQEKSDMTARYALLDKARQLAVDAAAMDQAIEVADELAAGFAVDAVQIKIDTIAALAPGDAPAEKQRAFAKVAMATFGEALTGDRFDVAKRAGGLAVAAARKSNDAKLLQRATDLGQQYKAAQEAFATASTAFTSLKTDPDNGPANLTAGRYRCFFKGEWATGLTQLAKGSNTELKGLAQKELSVQANADEQMAVADGWYDLADQYTSPAKDKLLAHASDWYEKALPGLSGISRIKAEKRVIAYDASRADEAGADSAKGGATTSRQALLQRIRTQVKEQRVGKTQEVGFTLGKQEAVAVPDTGALLLGFDVTHNGNRISSVRPIFLTEKGQVTGPMFGSPGQIAVKLIAKKGYAVAGMRARGGLWVDGLALTFMEIGPKGLDPSKTYQSDWVGGMGGNEFQLAGSGAPVVGVIGHGSKKDLTALGLVLGVQD